MLENTFGGMHVTHAFSDPSQVPFSRLKQRAQGEMGNIRVQSKTTGFVGREGSGCEARPLDLFKSSQDTTRASWELRGTPGHGDEAEKKLCLWGVFSLLNDAILQSLSFYRFKIV